VAWTDAFFDFFFGTPKKIKKYPRSSALVWIFYWRIFVTAKSQKEHKTIHPVLSAKSTAFWDPKISGIF